MTVKNLEFILSKSTWPMEKTFSVFGLLKQKIRKKKKVPPFIYSFRNT